MCGHDKMSVLKTAFRTKGIHMRKFTVLVCVLSILVLTLGLIGCGSGGSSAQTPQQVAKTFFEALGNKNATTTWNMLSASTRKLAKTETAWTEYLKTGSLPTKFTVGKVTVNGDKATVKVTGTVEGKASTESIPLVKENGVWKVDMSGGTG